MVGECISCVWAGFIISAICTFSIFDFGGDIMQCHGVISILV